MVSLRICGVRQSIAYPIVTIVRWIRLPCRSPIHHGIIEFTAVPFIEYALLDFEHECPAHWLGRNDSRAELGKPN